VKSVKKSNPKSFRFSPEASQIIDDLATRTGLTQVAVIEASARLLNETLSRPTQADARKAVKGATKPKKTLDS
jgi:predicted DNA-binding protein